MLNRIFVSTLLVLSVSLFISCKSSKKSSANPEDTVEPTTNSNAIEEESTSSTSSFLDQDCETTWSNMVALLPQGKELSVTTNSNKAETFKVSSSSTSSIVVGKYVVGPLGYREWDRSSTSDFVRHWRIQPPQDLRKSVFISQCNELKNIINNNSYNAQISNTTVTLGGSSYDAITLKIQPSSNEKGNFGNGSVFSKLYSNLSSRSGDTQTYTITFTQSHMFIQQRVYQYAYTGFINKQTNTEAITSTVSF